MAGTADDWVIYIRPMPSFTPPEIRIRTLLKRARRDLHLACVIVRDPTQVEAQDVNLHEKSCDVWDQRSCNCEPTEMTTITKETVR